MFSVPPTSAHSLWPASISSAASTTAWQPAPQRRFTVSAGTRERGVEGHLPDREARRDVQAVGDARRDRCPEDGRPREQGWLAVGAVEPQVAAGDGAAPAHEAVIFFKALRSPAPGARRPP